MSQTECTLKSSHRCKVVVDIKEVARPLRAYDNVNERRSASCGTRYCQFRTLNGVADLPDEAFVESVTCL